MSFDERSYEDKQMATVAKWAIGLVVAVFVIMIYQSIVNGYSPTGKKSELMSAEVVLNIKEMGSHFSVYVSDKEFHSGFSCRSEPVKKKAVVFYRMTEVKTFTGKYKIVPVFDADLSCKSIVSNVQVS